MVDPTVRFTPSAATVWVSLGNTIPISSASGAMREGDSSLATSSRSSPYACLLSGDPPLELLELEGGAVEGDA